MHLLCKDTLEEDGENVGGFFSTFTHLQLNFLPKITPPQFEYLLAFDALKDCKDFRELDPLF